MANWPIYSCPKADFCPQGSGFAYEYHLKDHLGNTSVTYTAGAHGSTAICQNTAYYPFGLPINALSHNTESNPYLYNGKELHSELQMDLFDYGTRYYDAEVGRFHTIDPLAEKYSFQSPYVYAANNPVKFVDENGENPIIGAIFGAAILKGVAGAAIDAGIQVAISYAQSGDIINALGDIDYTSVVGSGVTSGLSVPGVSRTVKAVGTVISIGVDAVVDVTKNHGNSAIGGIGGTNEKPSSAIASDVIFGIVGEVTPKKVISSTNKAATSDLNPSTFAVLTKENQQLAKTTANIASSDIYKNTIQSFTDLTVGSSGAINSVVKSNFNQTSSTATGNPRSYSFPEYNYYKKDNTNVTIPAIQ
jgi:RHS repeat-associated protein